MSAPSFPSFPPSFSSFPDLDADTSTLSLYQSTKKTSRDKDKRERRRERLKDKKRSHGSTRDVSDYHSLAGSHYLEHDPSPAAKETSRSYYSDRKGDPYNIQYGGLHAGDIPKYRIIDRGRHILGLSRSWTVTHRSGKGIEVGPMDRRKMRSLSDSTARALLFAPPTRRVLQSGDTYKYPEVDGFLRLPSSRPQGINSESYRSIIVSNEDDDSDTDASDVSDQVSNDEGSSDEMILTSYQEKLKQLERAIADEPESTDNWLQLLSHTLSTVPLLSKNATRARSEITVSILARAFAADIRNGSSKTLRIQYLRAGEEVWDESKVRAEWEEALKIGGVEIWMEWLEWRIRQAASGVDGVIEDVIRMFGVLSQSEQDELAKVRVFWRVAVVFQRAGYVERATALFQAQAELLFQIPQVLYGLPHEIQLGHLENFWESEVPRIGEAGSRGWAAWVSGHREDLPSKKQGTMQIIDLDPYRQWAARESRMDEFDFLPSRSSDDTDDPYSTIIFSDIRPLLIPLTSAVAKNAFRQAWLSFAGLYIPGFSLTLSTSNEINWDDRWNLAHLTRRPFIDALFPSRTTQTQSMSESIAGVIVGREKQYADPRGPIKCWGSGVLRPLDAIKMSEKGKMKAAMWGMEDVQGLDHEFIRRLLAQLRLGADDVDWDILTLAFEAAINVKTALKRSRCLLSQNESLIRWAAHAQLEMIRGSVDDARKIYQTVLTASSATSLQGTSNLWWDWAHMEWINGDSGRALQVVLRSAGVEGHGGVVVLRCKRGLDDVIRGEKNWKDREGWIKLRALLEILVGRDVTSALQVFDDHLNGECKKGPCRESLLVACLLTVYQHGVVLKNSMAPAVLRQRVEMAMKEYPSNSVVLGLFLEGERGQGVWGRVRGMLGESGSKAKDVARRVEEVWIAGWEKGRWSGEIERTRSGLAGAVDSDRTRASHILWGIYIEFEIRTGELQHAKKLLFRAIRECPLVKDLYLLAFGPLRSVFSGKELIGIADTMAERGLRLRAGLDEGLAGWKGEVDAGTDLESDGADEIMDSARELRRLMPY
ncbi:hypothetical protein C0995_011861 [Termitomyces sp. Mi166|nr:hypothetical protein C0995_011861 [Termitomyces sp. Mi166\